MLRISQASSLATFDGIFLTGILAVLIASISRGRDHASADPRDPNEAAPTVGRERQDQVPLASP
jgi:hypothetical protein